MIMAFFLAGIMNLGSYWFSDKIVLAMYRAQEIAPQDHPEIHQIVHGTGPAGRSSQTESLFD